MNTGESVVSTYLALLVEDEECLRFYKVLSPFERSLENAQIS